MAKMRAPKPIDFLDPNTGEVDIQAYDEATMRYEQEAESRMERDRREIGKPTTGKSFA
jgi:hypothetical protein